jgi:hypothetical protein
MRPPSGRLSARLSGRKRTRIGLVEIVSFPETATPGGLRAQVLTLQRQAWPGAAPGHDPALRPVSMLLVDEGVVLAALDILFKQIAHAGRRWGAAGLSTVVTGREQSLFTTPASISTRARSTSCGSQLAEIASG